MGWFGLEAQELVPQISQAFSCVMGLNVAKKPFSDRTRGVSRERG